MLILVLFGLWLWDAFYRPHIAYFANVTTARGHPEGIGPLSAEQVRARNLTLMFLKDGRKGQIKEIRATNSRGAAPPEFAYVPTLSLVALNPFRENAEFLNTSRVAFEYANRRLVKQSAYNRSNRLLYTLHYPRPDYAEYKWEVFSKVVSESGITHIKIVRPETGPEAGLNKELLFMDSNGTPRPDHDGSFGQRRLFDKAGLIVEEIPLDQHGQPAPDRLGIAKTTIEYDRLGNPIKLVNLGMDDRPVADGFGSAELKMRYDQHGNMIHLAHFGADGQPVSSPKMGSAARAFAYDHQGNIIENSFFGPDRQLMIGSWGFAKQTISWNERGESTETYFAADGKLVPVGGRVIKRKGVWDKHGHLAEMTALDEKERPMRDDRGCVKTRMVRDEHGNVTEVTCLDEKDQPVRDNRGAARVQIRYDQRGNRIEQTYYKPTGQLGFYQNPFVRMRWQYNPQGKATEVAYFDAADKPVRTREGYARITYAYDLQGNQRELAFFDEKGRPTTRKGGYAKIVRTYDARKNLLEEVLLSTEEKPVRSDDGYSKSRFGYDARGYRIEVTYYDERDRPATNEEGCARIGNQYNDKGQWTEWACFGADGSSIVAKKHGYAKARRIFDAGGNLVRVDYVDPNNVPARSASGYARIRYSYDDLGRETKREFFDVDGAPLLTRVIIQKVEPDSASVDLKTGDVIIAYDGQELADNRWFHELELTAGERRRQLTIERAGRILMLDIPAGRLMGIETDDRVPAARDKSISIRKKRPG
jgi:hypothetical protein